MNQKTPHQEAYNELSYYTLSHPSKAFIHQHIVDAFTAQTADKNTKPIALMFALAGLYLFLEKGFTGKQVQNMHVQMAKTRKTWPQFELPESRGEITVFDVLSATPGEKKDDMIKKWCESVWDTYKNSHIHVEQILKPYLL